MGAASGWGLLEREGEVEEIASLIDAACNGDGGLIVIDGPPGIGKSALLAASRHWARERGISVLAGHGSELEADYAFGLVRQLFGEPLARVSEQERGELLAGSAGLSAALLTGGAPVQPPVATDRVAPMIHGLYSLTASLARREPVLIAVDDCHWADAASLRFLLHLSRRLEGLRAAVIAAVRGGERSAERGAVAELAAAASVLTPAAFTPDAVSALAERELGDEPDPHFTVAVHEVTGGNPFLLRMLLNVLRADAVAPTEDAAELVTKVGPQTVSRTSLLRLSRQSEGGAALARALAVLGGSAELRHAAALAQLDRAAAAQAADALRGAHILSASPAPEFEHPIVRSAIYADIPPGRRSLMHGEAAVMLAADGASHERVAQHYLHVDPSGDPLVVTSLMDASETALGYGAPETAIAYLRRALEEPPAPAERAHVLQTLGRAELLMRDPEGIAHLQAAAEAANDPLLRGAIVCDLVEALVFAGQVGDARELARQAAAELPADADELRLRLLSTFAAAATMLPEEAGYEEEKRQLRELAASGCSHTRAAQLMLAALDAFAAQRTETVVARIGRGLDGGRLLSEVSAEAWPLAQAAVALISLDHVQDARALTESMIADARTRGSVLGLAAGCAHRGYALSRQGDLAAAEADLRSALELSMEHQLLFTIPFCFGYLRDVMIECDSAADLVAMLDVIPVAGPMAGSVGDAMLHDARGGVRLGRGELADAATDLRHAGQIWDAMGLRNPNVSCWRSALALCIGPDSEAALALARDELALASELGSARAIGVASRAIGLLEGGPSGLDQLERAVAAHRQANMPLELARSLCDRGAALRRANQRVAAREPLREALGLATRCSATRLAHRAEQELRAAGARPRTSADSGVAALTPSERRVVDLAAGGMSNPEIAQALFITINTVETHLRSAFRKLDVRSRAELAPLLAHATSE